MKNHKNFAPIKKFVGSANKGWDPGTVTSHSCLSKSKTQRRHSRRATVFHIATYNVRTICDNSENARLYKFGEALKKINFDVIGLSEVKRYNEIFTDHSSYLFYHNGTKDKKGMVGFVINSKWRQNIASVKSTHERIAVLELKLKKKKFVFIQVYAPTSASSDEIIEDFYSNLKSTLIPFKNFSHVYLLGDFNAKIGKALDGDDDVMGVFGFGERNERGQMLIQFARENQFFFVNTILKKNDKRRTTWSLGKAANEIDFVLIKQDQKKSVRNYDVINKFDYDSDHKMVRLSIFINRLSSNKRRQNKRLTISNDKELIKQFKDSMLTFQPYDENKLVKANYSSLVNQIKESALVFHRPQESLSIISANTKKAIEDRENLRKVQHRSDDDKKRFRDKRKAVNNLIAIDVRVHEIRKMEAAIDNKKGWKKANKGVVDGKNRILKIKNSNGDTLTDTDEILEEFANFYEKLYTSTLTSEERKLKMPNLDEYDDVEEFSFDEVKFALLSLKNDRAPGDDNIPADLLKICDDNIIESFRLVFNQVLRSEEIPKDWLESTIIVVHKKGDKANINNYRPISKTSHIYKWFMKIIQHRIKPDIEKFQTPAQAAYRKDYSITDHLFTITQVIEKCNEHKIEAHIGLMDYSKAFDSLEHHHLYQALVDAKVEKKYIRIIKEIYSKSTAKIKMEKCSRIIMIGRGIRQGCCCSTDFFITSLEKIYRTIDINVHGIDVDENKFVDTRFADDRAVTCKSAKDLELAMEKISEASKEAGLIDNFEKTKIITNSTTQSYVVNGHILEPSEREKYLGQIISFTDREAEINERIAAGWRAFHANEKFLRGSLPMYHKKEIFDKKINKVLTFGCQNWNLNEAQKNKLATAQHDMERRVLHVRRIDKVKLTKIRKITKWQDTVEFAERMKHNWAGHVARMDLGRWPKRMLIWKPSNQRARGRPKSRWEDEIINRTSIFWKRKAQDKKKWATLAKLN